MEVSIYRKNIISPGNNKLIPEGLLKNYYSVRWTEDYRGNGDFEIKAPFTPENYNLLRFGKYVKITGSYRVMRIHRVETDFERDGGYIKVSGPSLEYILAYRVLNFRDRITNSYVSGVRNAHTLQYATLGAFVRGLVHRVCISNSSGDTAQKIGDLGIVEYGNTYELAARYYQAYTSFPEKSDGSDVYRIKPGAVKTILDRFLEDSNVGYAILHNRVDDGFGFSAFTGRDLSDQVVLDPRLDTIDRVKTIVDFSDYLSTVETATVDSENGLEMGYIKGNFPRPSIVTSYSTFSSRVSMPSDDFSRLIGVETMDRDQYNRIEQEIREDPDIPNNFPRVILENELALDALKDRKVHRLTEGSVSRNTRYVYERDYTLTDIVRVSTPVGSVKARVVSNTMIADEKGTQSFPIIEQMPD